MSTNEPQTKDRKVTPTGCPIACRTMNTTSLSTHASAASLPLFNDAVSMWSPATSIVQAAAVKDKSHSFLATARAWFRDLFTPSLMREVEPRSLPSVAFMPSGPLVYQWQIYTSQPARLRSDNREQTRAAGWDH
jgi:hypothetical protein